MNLQAYNNNCPQEEIFQAYLDRELSKDEAALFEAHLMACPKCREELAIQKAMILEFKNNFPQSMPDPSKYLNLFQEKLTKRKAPKACSGTGNLLQQPFFYLGLYFGFQSIQKSKIGAGAKLYL